MASFIQAYNRACLIDSCTPDLPHPSPAIQDIWKLDIELRERFAGYIAQYEQGLIHSMELLNGLYYEASKERK